MRRGAVLLVFLAVLPRSYEAHLTPLACYVHGLKVIPTVAASGDVVRNVSNEYNCQTACAWHTGCKYFSYDSASLTCSMSGKDFYASRDDSVISGPASCVDAWGDNDPCSAMPGPGFPGATPSESFDSWPMNFVPFVLQCWPHAGKDLQSCEDVADKVLEDTAKGWPGKCQGLSKVTVAAGSTCKQQCEQDIMCPSWQEVEDGENGTSCWHGLGYDCWDVARALPVRSAQRIMRGSYRVLMDLTNYDVSDLRNVLGPDVFGQNIPVAKTVCKRACLSLLSCEIWLFSTETGCWVNDPSFKTIPYPPTTATFRTSTDAATHVVAGEYLQRLCKDSGLGTTVPPTTPASSSAAPVPNPTMPAESNRFVKGTAGGATYFEEAKAGVKHVVRRGCGACPSARPPCDTVTVVGEGYLQGLQMGEDFRCDMWPGGSTQGGIDDLAVATSTSLRPAFVQDAAPTTGGSSSTETSGMILGMPWFVWAALILLPCCAGLALFGWQGGKCPEPRASRRSKRSMKFDEEKADAVAQGARQETAGGWWQPLVSYPDQLDVQWQEPVAQGAVATVPQILQQQPTGQYPCVAPPTRPGVPVWAEGPQNVPTTMLQPAPTSLVWGGARMATLQVQQAGGLAGADYELDLVRVTPDGLEISPLQGPPPPGLRIITPVPN